MINQYMKKIPSCPSCDTPEFVVMNEVTNVNKFGKHIVMKWCQCTMCKGRILISSSFINGKLTKITSEYTIENVD